MDEEERNYFCLVLLVTRVGVQTLRQHFLRKWGDVGTGTAWTDSTQNGKDLLAKFKPRYEKVKVKSGDTTSWDVSLLVKAIVFLNTRPPVETSLILAQSLDCLRETRNKVCHPTNGKITTAVFNELWRDACNALGKFGATLEDFQKVEKDVNLPFNELTSLLKQYAKQDDEILLGLNTIITRLETLVQGQLDIREGQEEIKKMIEKMEATISIEGKVLTAGGLVVTWAAGSAFIIHDPETLKELVQGAIIPTLFATVASVRAILPGSFKIVVEVQSLDALDAIWKSYNEGDMKKKLEKVLVTDEMRHLAPDDAESVDISLMISEEEYKKTRDYLVESVEVLTRLEKLEQGQHEMKEGQEKNKEEIKEMFKDGLDQVKKMHYGRDASSTRQVQLSTEDVQRRSICLKTSAKRETEFQPKLISSLSIASAKTDEIFTNLKMQYGRKSLPEGASRREQLSEYSTLSGKPIKRCQDIFIPQDKGKTHPKSILVTGKAGIGKSIFCQKLVRDWADNNLFEEELQTKTHGFDFVYLLPFRQINLFDNEQLTLMELLNRSSLLDERSNIDEQLLEYMIEHQGKVLFILDGYDEYKERGSITTDCVDQKHKSNPRIAMPVPALLSKLLKGRIFGEAVVMVTSRPTESNELGGMNFDALVEIIGFSPEQVEEFIGKYYGTNSKMKDDVLGHVRENEDLISLAHVPMFCFLMCWCMEFHMEFKTDQDFPVNMTEMYSEVVEIFELKHNSQSQYRAGEIPELLTEFPAVVKSTFEKLSKLAVKTMKKNIFNFEEKELKNIGLSSEEIGDLKLSGLLTSGPGLRTSVTTITRYYCFSHLTLHEYFTARWYVENAKVPSLKEIDSEMVFQFFCGLCAKAPNGKDLVKQLLLSIRDGRQQDDDDDVNHHLRLLLVRLLYVYGDKDFGMEMIEKHFFRLLLCCRKGILSFFKSFGSKEDCNILCFYIDLLNLFCETHNELVTNAHESMVCEVLFPLSGFNVSQIKQLFKVLPNSFSPITSMWYVVETQESIDVLCDALPSTNINKLTFVIQKDVDLTSLRKALLDTNCKVKDLTLLNAILHDEAKRKELSNNLNDFSQQVGRSKSDIKIKFD